MNTVCTTQTGWQSYHKLLAYVYKHRKLRQYGNRNAYDYHFRQMPQQYKKENEFGLKIEPIEEF